MRIGGPRFAGLFALLWTFDDQIPALMLVGRGHAGVQFTSKLFASAHVPPNGTIEPAHSTSACIAVTTGKRSRNSQPFWENYSVAARGGSLGWARDACIYEVFLGRKGFRNADPNEQYPDIRALIRDLPRMRWL